MTQYPHPRELAPHAAPMLLVDRVVHVDATRIHAQTIVSASNLFFMPGRGLPSYVAFELMAQSVSIFDGWRRRQNGEAPQIGFLLGCRKYRVARDWLLEGETIDIECASLIDEGEMRSFDCRILVAGAETASGTINVYRPDDPARVLAAGGL
jgi:predicted hotdog family 3-hydroxylacyl-ACP dehydratase